MSDDGWIRNAITCRRFNSGGPGGQHQNTTENAIELALTDSAARQLGIPRVTATASLKSQHASKRAAEKLLRVRIAAEIRKRDARGRYTAGTKRVRNYHEPDDRVTDASGARWSWRGTVGKGKIGHCVDGRRSRVVAGVG